MKRLLLPFFSLMLMVGVFGGGVEMAEAVSCSTSRDSCLMDCSNDYTSNVDSGTGTPTELASAAATMTNCQTTCYTNYANCNTLYLPTMISADDSPSNISRNTMWGGSLRMAIREVVDYFLYFMGLIATIMIIYAGALYITAMGDDTKLEEAKKIITYAAIGIVVILLSFSISHTVLSSGLDMEPASGLIDPGRNQGLGRQ